MMSQTSKITQKNLEEETCCVAASEEDQNIFCENCRIIKTIYWKPQKEVKCVCEAVKENGDLKNILETEANNRINLVTDLHKWKTLIPKIQSFSNEQLNGILSSPNIENSMSMIAYIINSFAKFKEDFLSLLHFLDKRIFFQLKNLGKICEIKDFVDELKPDSNGNFDFSHIESDPQLETLSVRLGLFLIENDLNFGENNFLEEISQELLGRIDAMSGRTGDFVMRIMQFYQFLAHNPLIPIDAYEGRNVNFAYEELREKLNEMMNGKNNNQSKENNEDFERNNENNNNNIKIKSNNKKESNKSINSSSNKKANEQTNQEHLDTITQLNEQLTALLEIKGKYEADIMKLISENNQLKEEQKKSHIWLKAAQDELETIYFQVQKISENCKLEPQNSSLSVKSNNTASKENMKKSISVRNSIHESTSNRQAEKAPKAPFSGGSEASKFKACLDTLALIEEDLSAKKNNNLLLANLNMNNNMKNSIVVADAKESENALNSSKLLLQQPRVAQSDKEAQIRLMQKSLIEEKLNQSFSGKFETEIKKYKEQVSVLQEIMYTAQQDNKSLQAELEGLSEARGIIEIEAKHLKQICDYNEACQKNLLETLQKILEERENEYENFYGNEIAKPCLALGESNSIYDAVENYVLFICELDKFYFKLHKEFDRNKAELEELKIAFDNQVAMHKSFKCEVLLRKKQEDEKFSELNLSYLELETKLENYLLKYDALEKELVKEKIKNAIFSEGFEVAATLQEKRRLFNDDEGDLDVGLNAKDLNQLVYVTKESDASLSATISNNNNNNSYKNNKEGKNNKNNNDEAYLISQSKSFKNVIKKKFINEYEQCLRELEGKQLALNKLQETYEAEVKSLTEKINSLQSNISKQQTEYEEFLEVKNKYFDEKQTSEENLLQLKNEVFFLKKKAEDSKEYINYIQKQNSELKEKLKIQNPAETNLFLLMNSFIGTTASYKIETDYKQLQSMIHSLLEEREKIVAEVFMFYEKYENLSTQKNSYQELCEKQSAEIKELNKQKDLLSDKDKESQKIQMQLNAIEKENLNLKNLLEKKKEELVLEITDNENAKHNSIIGGIENEGDDFLLLKTSNLNLNYKLENFRDKIILLETENNFLSTKINECENQLGIYFRKLKDFEKLKFENLNIKSTNSTFTCENKILKNEISLLNSKLSKHNIEIIKLKSEAQLNDKSLSNIFIPGTNTLNKNELNNSKLLNISSDNLNFDYNLNYNIIKNMKVEKTGLSDYKPINPNVSGTFKTSVDNFTHSYSQSNLVSADNNINVNSNSIIKGIEYNSNANSKYDYVGKYTQGIAKLEENEAKYKTNFSINNNLNNANSFETQWKFNAPKYEKVDKFNYSEYNTPMFSNDSDNASVATFTKKATNANPFNNFITSNTAAANYISTNNMENTSPKFLANNNNYSPLNTEASQNLNNSQFNAKSYKDGNFNNNVKNISATNKINNITNNNYNINNSNNTSFTANNKNFNNDNNNLNRSNISSTSKNALNTSANKSSYHTKNELEAMNLNKSIDKSFEKVISISKTYTDASTQNKVYTSYKNTSSLDFTKVNQIVNESKNFTSTESAYDVTAKLSEIDRIYADSINKIKKLDKNSTSAIFTGKIKSNFKSGAEAQLENSSSLNKSPVKFQENANASSNFNYSSGAAAPANQNSNSNFNFASGIPNNNNINNNFNNFNYNLNSNNDNLNYNNKNNLNNFNYNFNNSSDVNRGTINSTTMDEVQNILNKYTAKNSLNYSNIAGSATDPNKFVSSGNENAAFKFDYLKTENDANLNTLNNSYLNNPSYCFTDVNRSGNEMSRSDISNSSFSNIGVKANFNNLDTYSNFGDRSFDYKPGFYNK